MKKSFYIKTFIRKGCNTLLVFLCSLFSLFSYAQIYTTGDAILYVSQDAILTQKLITPTKIYVENVTTVVGLESNENIAIVYLEEKQHKTKQHKTISLALEKKDQRVIKEQGNQQKTIQILTTNEIPNSFIQAHKKIIAAFSLTKTAKGVFKRIELFNKNWIPLKKSKFLIFHTQLTIFELKESYSLRPPPAFC